MKGSAAISPSSPSQAVNLRTASWRERAVAGWLPDSSRAVTQPRRLERSSGWAPVEAH
jgi:hypothetical protein